MTAKALGYGWPSFAPGHAVRPLLATPMQPMSFSPREPSGCPGRRRVGLGWLLIRLAVAAGSLPVAIPHGIALAQPQPQPAGDPKPGAEAAGDPKPGAEPPGGAADHDAEDEPPGDATGDEESAPTPTPGTPAAAASAEPSPPPAATALPPTEGELARGKRIKEVRLVGNRRISKDEIEGTLKAIVVGRPFDPAGVTADVRTLWDAGDYNDLEVDVSTTGDEVSVRLIVEERPSVKDVVFKGNASLSEDDLTELAKAELKPGSIFKDADARRTIQKIRDKYAEDSYFLAEVAFEAIAQKENQVNVVFTVREHEKVSVRRVTIVGNDSIPESELLELMATGNPGLLSFGSGGPFRQDMFERDVLVLQSHYYDLGFLTVQVAAPRVMLTPDRSGIDIVVPVDEGPRFKLRRLEIVEVDQDGKAIEPLLGKKKLRDLIRAKTGDYFNRAELIKDIAEIQTLYRNRGYAFVDAAPHPQLYPDDKLTDITVRIKRGSLARFGRIEIKGNTKTRDKVLRREMEIAEGALFSESGLERSRERITRLGYFERVDVNTEASTEPGVLHVNVEVTERPTGTFQVGAGFSSVESFIATAQVQQANLFGRGQSLALMAQLSGLRRLFDVRLVEPYLFDTRLSATVNAFEQERLYDDFALNSRGGSVTLGYPLVDPELSFSLTYTLKDDIVDDRSSSSFFGTASAVSVFQRLPLANLFADGISSSFRPALTYDTRNNRLFPTKGVFLQGSTELALAALGSDNEYIRHRLTGRFYYPLTSKLVFKVNAEAGLVTSPDESGVPLFARTFLGGIYDLRGFKLRGVGPRLPLKTTLDENASFFSNGAVIGGNLSYFQNIELEMPILEAVNLSGVVFTDLGNAWNLENKYCLASPAADFDVSDPCFDAGDLFNVRTSWGFGLRWFSPLGPLRFEWGFPFKPLPFEEASVFEFTIGNFF